MDFKQHAHFALHRVRSYTNQLLAAFETPQQWVYRPTPESNHALWILGHLALADNRFATRFREHTDVKPSGYEATFWLGSTCQADIDAYPPLDDLRAYFVDRRENLLGVLEAVTPAELDAPLANVDPKSPMAAAPSMGHWFLFAANHEMSHAGQLSVCRRGLGHPPLR